MCVGRKCNFIPGLVSPTGYNQADTRFSVFHQSFSSTRLRPLPRLRAKSIRGYRSVSRKHIFHYSLKPTILDAILIFSRDSKFRRRSIIEIKVTRSALEYSAHETGSRYPPQLSASLPLYLVLYNGSYKKENNLSFFLAEISLDSSSRCRPSVRCKCANDRCERATSLTKSPSFSRNSAGDGSRQVFSLGRCNFIKTLRSGVEAIASRSLHQTITVSLNRVSQLVDGILNSTPARNREYCFK